MIDYGEVPGVNFSTLKHMAKSPLAYRHAVENRRADTPDLAVGRYVHALVFEPDSVAERYAVHDGTHPIDYVVYEHGDRRGKVWEAFKALHEGRTILKPDEAADIEAGRSRCARQGPVWKAFEAAHPGKTLFVASEAKPAQDMAAAVRAHPLVRPYLDAPDGVFEEVLTWVDPYTRIACKARLDWHIQSLSTIIDLKTARSIDMREFGAIVARYDYHSQIAHYANGLDVARGWMPQRQLFVAVEKTPPHDVLVGVLDEQAKDLARSAVRGLLERVAECRKADAWPGRYSEEQTVQLPGWVFGGEPEIEFEEDTDGAH